jgi:hypothetical protein
LQQQIDYSAYGSKILMSMRLATENLSKILLINQSEDEVKIHLQIEEYQQL